MASWQAPLQHIWIFCKEPEAAEDVRSFCTGCRRQKLVPQIVDRPVQADWLTRLRPLVPVPPAPYSFADLEDFWADVSVLFTASMASMRLFRAKRAKAEQAVDSGSHLRHMRWPSLLVTDRAKLCRLTTNSQALGALAAAVSMPLSDLVPVVLTSDLGLVTGNLVRGAPVSIYKSLTMLPMPSEKVEKLPKSRLVHVPLGVFVQRYQELPPFQRADAEDPPFGARCLALCGDGQSAYFAVSADGVRAVQAAGPWKVLNGHVVIGGATKKSKAKLLELSRHDVHMESEPVYSEPVHIPIEDLDLLFEAPLRFNDWASMLVGSATGTSLGLNGTLSGPALVLEPSESEEPPAVLPDPDPQDHAARNKELQRLVQLAREQEEPSEEKGATTQKFPRLLGLSRALTVTPQVMSRHGTQAFMDFEEDEDDDEDEDGGMRLASPKSRWDFATSSGLVPSAAGTMQRLTAYAEVVPHDTMPQSHPTCCLLPGTYSLSAPATAITAARHLEMVLHANATCEFQEKLGSSSLRSLPGVEVEWMVSLDGSILQLQGKDASSPAFQVKEARGSRIVERSCWSVQVPVATVRSLCKFVPFPQQSDPFVGYTSRSRDLRIFGQIDPESPALATMKCRADRIPFSAFEHELRQLGMPVEEIMSDFTFIDRDQDGQLTVADMRRLEEYGSPVAAPEVIDELRSVLIEACGSLMLAFEALQGMAHGGKVTAEVFEDFVMQDPSVQSKGKQQSTVEVNKAKIHGWSSRTTAEDRSAVFASINPCNSPHIELSDFLCLNLHTAVVALRRLEHFQGWIFEQFGRTKQAFARVFKGLAKQGKQEIDRKDFIEGAQTLGYPASQKATRTIFSLLDRNFDGEVSTREFERLAEFQTEQFVASLEALQSMAEEKFGTAEECFQHLLKKEAAAPGSKKHGKPTYVSFNTFQKVCDKAGFTKENPTADLRMVFLFLDEASGKSANGQLTESEWSLLKGFSSRAITGSPARLRRILEEHYGGAAPAFQRMHTAWMRRALPQGLRQTALMGLARAICELPGVGEEEEDDVETLPSRSATATPSMRKAASTTSVAWNRSNMGASKSQSSSATKLPSIYNPGGKPSAGPVGMRSRPAWAMGDTV